MDYLARFYYGEYLIMGHTCCQKQQTNKIIMSTKVVQVHVYKRVLSAHLGVQVQTMLCKLITSL